MDCTVKKYLKIEKATPADYKKLEKFHYRENSILAPTAVYKIVDSHPLRSQIEPLAGIIVYAMPAPAVQMRNIATAGLFTSLNREQSLQLVNKNIRTIARVIIEPRWRGLGLAQQLIKETMPLIKFPYIEALAVMGRINPFFKKAGMLEFDAPLPKRHQQLMAALNIIGMESKDLIDAHSLHSRLENQPPKTKSFIKGQIGEFLAGCGKPARNLTFSQKTTEFIINKLTDRPVYYLWRNPELKLKI